MTTEPKEKSRWASWRKRYLKAFLSGGAVLAVAGIAIAILLLTQTFPAGVSAGNVYSTTCVDAGNPLTANLTSYIAGVETYIRFTCTTDSRAYTTQGGISATPTFSLPAPFTELWSFRSTTSTGTTCAAGTGAWQMTSASSHTFPSGGAIGWDYCALIPTSATADSTSFTVAWNNP